MTKKEPTTAASTAIIGSTGVASPIDMPVIRFIAGPAWEDSATWRTGPRPNPV